MNDKELMNNLLDGKAIINEAIMVLKEIRTSAWCEIETLNDRLVIINEMIDKAKGKNNGEEEEDS